MDKIQTGEPTPEQATEPTKHKKSKSKLQQKLMNGIKDDKKDIINEIFWNYLSIRIHRF